MTFPDAPDVRFALHAATHKGLRLLMARTLQAVGRMDAGDDAELQAALAQLDSLRVLLSAHMRHEGRVVLTAIEAHQPGGALRSGQDHAVLFEGLAGLHDEARA
ncbi:MAG: hypothetical protein WAQ05_17735, partial [Rubrivivax sp.]